MGVRESVWNGFFKTDNIDPSKVNMVQAQFDPTPPTTCLPAVAGWSWFYTNELNLLRTEGTSARARATARAPRGIDSTTAPTSTRST